MVSSEKETSTKPLFSRIFRVLGKFLRGEKRGTTVSAQSRTLSETELRKEQLLENELSIRKNSKLKIFEDSVGFAKIRVKHES